MEGHLLNENNPLKKNNYVRPVVWVRSHASKWPKELESLSLFSYSNNLFEMLLTINFDNSGGHILHLSLLQPGTLQARKRMQSHVSIYLFIYLASHIYSQ